MLRALIFDFDGVIVDTESSSLSAVQEAYRRHGRNGKTRSLASRQTRGHAGDRDGRRCPGFRTLCG